MIEHKLKDGVETKRCAACGQWISISEFHKGTRASDGLQSYCKSCKRDFLKAHRESQRISSKRSYALRHEKELATRAARRAAMEEEDILGDLSFQSRYWAKVNRGSGCWEWMGYRQRGNYGQIGFAGGLVSAHRVAWILTNGPIPAGLLVCHRCDNRNCCNPAHLFLGTQQDNIDDMLAKGRGTWRSGERSAAAKLTWALVNEIRQRYANGNIKQRELGAEYGVSARSISSVLLNQTWRDPNYIPPPKWFWTRRQMDSQD